jgi:hypothetical protein
VPLVNRDSRAADRCGIGTVLRCGMSLHCGMVGQVFGTRSGTEWMAQKYFRKDTSARPECLFLRETFHSEMKNATISGGPSGRTAAILTNMCGSG